MSDEIQTTTLAVPAPSRDAAVVPAADGNFVPFWEYFSEAFVPLQGIDIPLKAAHREICDTLEDAFFNGLTPNKDADGKEYPVEYVIINMPPRIGKTKILEGFETWVKGNFPDTHDIFTGYSGDLIEGSLAYIALVMQSDWFQACFGDLLHVKRSDKLGTVKGGMTHAEGTGGSLTGKGAGLKRVAGGFICIDDPAKPEAALSPVESESLRRWFETTLRSRRNSDRFCPIIIIAQRLAPDDLPGYILETYPKNTRLLKFPALVNEVSQFPETISTETLQALKKTRYGRFVLASQYQQEPIALGGNLIQTASFRRYKRADVAGVEWEELLITVDTALKIKESNDYSCFQLWGKLKGKIYLLDQMHGKWESPALLANAMVFSNKCRDAYPMTPLRMVIEEKAAGTGLIQQLNVAGIPAEGIERDIDKVRRVQAILPYQEAGLVFIPADDEPDTDWLGGFLTECAQFKPDGTHAHDDRVDCFADGVQILLGRELSILDVLGGKSKR